MDGNFQYPSGEYVLLGRITKAHGMRGEVKMLCISGTPENISNYREIVLTDGTGRLSRPVAITGSRSHGRLAIIQLASISSRNDAEELEGFGVLLAKEQLPAIGADEYYHYQYVGKMVVDRTSGAIGRVTAILANGAQDVLVIDDGGEEVLIPLVKEFIVDETEEEIIVDPPPGLLTINRGTGS